MESSPEFSTEKNYGALSKMIYNRYMKCYIYVNYIWQTLLLTADCHYSIWQCLMYDIYIHL